MSSQFLKPNRPDVRFSAEDANKANEQWKFNCGPGALCGVLGITPEELRPHCGDFESRGYTNPTLMKAILKNLNVKARQIFQSDTEPAIGSIQWPTYGVVRVQWAGPWTAKGVPIAARYRKTHWIGYQSGAGLKADVFDINAMTAGGWVSFTTWSMSVVPWILKNCVPESNGRWWPTHCYEIPVPEIGRQCDHMEFHREHMNLPVEQD